MNFFDEMKSIRGYVNYIENNFFERTKDFFLIDDDNPVNKYLVITTDVNEKKRNSLILAEVHHRILGEIQNLKKYLKNHMILKLPELPKEVLDSNSAELSTAYIKSKVLETMTNEDNLPYSQLMVQMDIDELKKDIAELDAFYDTNYYSTISIDDLKTIVNYARIEIQNEEIASFKQKLAQYEEMDELYKIIDEKYPINIYRHSFLQVVHIFENTISAIAFRLFLPLFFDLGPYLSDEKNISLRDIASCYSFDNFIANSIKQLIASKTVAELLEMIYQGRPGVFMVHDKNTHEQVFEMILRRDLHERENGIVNEAYKSRYGENTTLNIGDYASIDADYFYDAVEILSGIINNIENIVL